MSRGKEAYAAGVHRPLAARLPRSPAPQVERIVADGDLAVVEFSSSRVAGHHEADDSMRSCRAARHDGIALVEVVGNCHTAKIVKVFAQDVINLRSRVMDLRAERAALFSKPSDPATIGQFFDRVADDVHWVVEGVSPISGTYESKAEFERSTFNRLAGVMRSGIHLELQNLFVDEETVVVELRANSVTLEGAPYDYRLCWLCTFDSDRPDATIVAVRAYLDTVTVTWTLLRNETLPGTFPADRSVP